MTWQVLGSSETLRLRRKLLALSHKPHELLTPSPSPPPSPPPGHAEEDVEGQRVGESRGLLLHLPGPGLQLGPHNGPKGSSGDPPKKKSTDSLPTNNKPHHSWSSTSAATPWPSSSLAAAAFAFFTSG